MPHVAKFGHSMQKHLNQRIVSRTLQRKQVCQSHVEVSKVSTNPLFIQNCYYIVAIRHTTGITVTVDYKQGHLRAVPVIARIIRTWLFPSPFRC